MSPTFTMYRPLFIYLLRLFVDDDDDDLMNDLKTYKNVCLYAIASLQPVAGPAPWSVYGLMPQYDPPLVLCTWPTPRLFDVTPCLLPHLLPLHLFPRAFTLDPSLTQQTYTRTYITG